MAVRKKIFKYIVRIILMVIFMNAIFATLHSNSINAEQRTKTITDYWTSDWVEFKKNVDEPSTIKGRYYDSKSGQYVNYTLEQTGGLYRVDSKVDWINWRSPGSASWYDKDENYYLGFMSNNPTYYYAGRWSDSMPGEAPDRYYGIPRTLVDNDWKLIDYGWDEPNVVNADNWAAKGHASDLVYSNSSYWWRSESGNLNKYRKGVWIDYRIKVNLYKYRQKYTKTITLPDNEPPEHISDSLWSHIYREGNDYWTQPYDPVFIRLKQRDKEAGNERQYLRLRGSGQDERAVHDFDYGRDFRGDMTGFDSRHVKINSLSRIENTTYGTVNWKVTPKTHGHTYNVQYYYRDNANNSVGYNNTGIKLRVDGVAPKHIGTSIWSHLYKDRDTYWTKPNNPVFIRFRQRDVHSGNEHQYLRLMRNGSIEVRSRHDFFDGTYNQEKQVTSNHVSIDQAYRDMNGNDGRVRWKVTPKTHGHSYKIQRFYQDNVNNMRGYINEGHLSVDGVAPTVNFSPHNQGWTEGSITVKANMNDPHSGVKRFRYRIQNGDEWGSYSDWITGDSRTFKLSNVGRNRIHIQVQDNVGNTRNSYSGYYYVNNPPNTDFGLTPKPAYEGDDLLLVNQSTDPDGHDMTAEWEIKDPEGNTTTQTSWNAIIDDSLQGTYTVRLTVTDSPGGKDSVTKQFTVRELTVEGSVHHTDKWKEKHLSLGHPLNQYYSGEKFITTAEVTDHPIKSVKVEFAGNLRDGNILHLTEELAANPHPLYKGDVYDLKMSGSANRLENGTVLFKFIAEWKNGTVKEDLVEVDIIGSIYDYFDFHRTN